MDFDLSVADGTPRLTVADRALFGWVKLEALELEVPIRADDDVADAAALDYRTRRTRATRVSLRMDQADLDAFCAARGSGLGAAGIDELSLRAMDGYLSLGARVRVRGHVAEMTARLLATGHDGGVRLLIDEARTYGFLPEPAPSLAFRTISSLLATDRGRWTRAVGLAEFEIEPVAALLWNTLPSAGWRLPDTAALVCESIRARAGELTIVFATTDEAGPGPSNPYSALTQHLDSFRPADELMRAGEIAAALRAYRAELSARGSEHPFLVERILSIASSQQDYFVDALEMARQALGRWPDFAPAHNALAAIASAQNDGLEAAHRFQILATSHALVGDDEAAAKAALAGARLLRRLSPAESTALYELVLEHSPHESEAAEALSERYREENRWDDLLALIRQRVSRATDPAAAARDHIRLAQILADALGDARGAREELLAATRLDSSSGTAREALAQIEQTLGNTDGAVEAHDAAATLFEARGDGRNTIRALLSAAELVERGGNDAGAERRYRDIIDRVPNEAAALRGAASAAGRQGHWAEAAELWRMLLLSCADSALAQAECSYELGRALFHDGDMESSRPALERAARSGPPLIAAEAHALLAAIFETDGEKQAAAIELAASIIALTTGASDKRPGSSVPPIRLHSRAAELSLERALLLASMGQTEGASTEYRRAYELGGERMAVRREAATALLQMAEADDDVAERKRWIGALLESDPDDDLRRLLLLRRARLRLETDGDPDGAAADLAAALEGEGKDRSLTREALALRAEISKERGEPESRAEALAAQAELGEDEASVRASVEAAEAWIEAHQAGSAQTAAARALEIAEALEPSETLDALTARAHIALIDASWRQRRYEIVSRSATVLLDRSDELSGAERAVTRFRLAVALDQNGEDEEAATQYIHVENDPAADDNLRSQALRHLAELYERLGRYEDAARRFSDLASSPTSPLPESARADAWYRAAELYRKHQGRSGDAEACLEETLKLVSDHMPALDALETLKRDSDDYERVAVILGRKIAATSRHPSRQKSLLVRLAALQEGILGRVDVARETYHRALEIDPLYRPALRFAAADALRAHQGKLAVELFAKLAGDLPDDIDLPDDPAHLREERSKAALHIASIAAREDDEAISEIARVALERSLEDSEGDDAISAALESLYRRLGDWRALCESLAVAERVTLARDLERIEILWRQLDDAAGALVATRSARDRHPEQEQLREYEEALEELTSATDSTSNPGFAQEVAEALTAAREARARGESAAALAHLERIAGPASPDELLILRADLREQAGQWERTAHDLTMLRRRAASAGDLNREHRLCRRLATLTAEKLGDGMTALALYERALELDPEDLAAAEACVALFERRGDRAARATALERVVAIARRTGAGAQTLASALRDLASYALEEGRAGRAQQHLEEALEEAPGDEATLRLLAQVHADRGDISAQAETIRILAGSLADRGGGTSAAAGELYLELADLHYDAGAAPNKAREAMLVAARVFGPGSRSRSVLRLLANEAAGAQDNDTVVAALESIPENELNASDFIMLAKAYQRAARDQQAVTALEAARKRGRLDDEGALLLLALYRQLGRKRELARSLEDGASEAPAAIAATRLQEALMLYRVTLGDEARAARVEKQLTELAHVHQDSSDPELSTRPSADELERAAAAAASGQETAVAADLLAQALTHRASALAASKRDLDDATLATLESLRALARRDNHYEALARALLVVASVNSASSRSSTLLREAASITRQHLHNTRGAADLLARALALAPDDASLCEELDATLREAGDYSQLVSAYELHLGAVAGRRRAQPLLELGRLYRDIWSDPARARSYFSEVLEVAPELAVELDREIAELDVAMNPLEDTQPVDVVRIEPRSERTAGNKISGDGSDDNIDVADTLKTPPSRPQRSLDELLKRARELEESDQLDAAIAQAERAAALAGGDQRPLRALERLYKAVDDWGAVSEVLGRLAAAAADPVEAASIWFRRAGLYRDVLHREPEAYRCLKEAHANDPNNGTIANALRAVAMARGEWALAAELLYREIAAATADDERGALYLELALIYDEKLLDVDAAMVNYEQALAFDPEIPAAPKPLGRLYELRGRHAEASEMYELAAARARSDADRGRLLRHAGLSAEHADLHDEARRLYRLAAVAGSTEDHEKAQVALARLRGEDDSGNNDQRIRVLEARLDETDDPETERALRRELLELASSRGDAVEEIRHARELLEADRTDVSAYVALKSHAAEAGDWQQVASLLSSRAAAVTDASERAALYFELGRAYQDDLGDLNAAVGAYEQALAAAPDHAGSLEALAEITYRKHDWMRAFPIYQRLVPEACSMPADVIALRRGEIAEALGREHEACEAFAEAVRLFPASRAALTALARCAKRVGDLKRSISATRAILELAPPSDVNATTRARGELASLLARSGDITGAIYYYELVVAEEPKAITALSELLALYSEKGDFHGAARCTRSLIALSPDARQRADLLYRLGEIYRGHLDDKDLAADAYLKGIDLAPDHVPILRRLLEYYLRIGDAEQLLEVAGDLHTAGALAHTDTATDDLARIMVFATDAASWPLVDAISEFFGAATSARLVNALIQILAVDRISWSPSFLAAASAGFCAHAGLDASEIYRRVSELAKTNDSAKTLLGALAG